MAGRALLSLTYDLEMCTNFPYWTSVWDHRKGAIDGDTERYVDRLVDAAVQAKVPLQWFVLGISLEGSTLERMRRAARAGHPVGNHTFRHVYVKAKSWDQLQPAYRNDPSLAAGFTSPAEAVAEEIRQTSRRIRTRLGVEPEGFRTPGGFENGLEDAPEVRRMLLAQGFRYASSRYRLALPSGRRPTRDELEGAVVASVRSLQPYRYPDGLLEIPMMGISDVGAFRGLDLEREEWIRLLERGLEVARAEGLLFSVLMHPCVLASRDPHAATLRRLLERARALDVELATNDEIARRWNR